MMKAKVHSFEFQDTTFPSRINVSCLHSNTRHTISGVIMNQIALVATTSNAGYSYLAKQENPRGS